jgi:hypothetical protein
VSRLWRGVALPDVCASGIGIGVAVMDGVLSSALREATYWWLDKLETLVRDADVPSRAALADVELIRLVGAWRALLAEHEPDDQGRCPRCPRCSRWCRRRQGYSCSVWVTAHRCLVAEDMSGLARHSVPVGQRRALDPGG